MSLGHLGKWVDATRCGTQHGRFLSCMSCQGVAMLSWLQALIWLTPNDPNKILRWWLDFDAWRRFVETCGSRTQAFCCGATLSDLSFSVLSTSTNRGRCCDFSLWPLHQLWESQTKLNFSNSWLSYRKQWQNSSKSLRLNAWDLMALCMDAGCNWTRQHGTQLWQKSTTFNTVCQEPWIPLGFACVVLWWCSCMLASPCWKPDAAGPRMPQTCWWRTWWMFVWAHLAGGPLVGHLHMERRLKAMASSVPAASLASASTPRIHRLELSHLFHAQGMAARAQCWAGSSNGFLGRSKISKINKKQRSRYCITLWHCKFEHALHTFRGLKKVPVLAIDLHNQYLSPPLALRHFALLVLPLSVVVSQNVWRALPMPPMPSSWVPSSIQWLWHGLGAMAGCQRSLMRGGQNIHQLIHQHFLNILIVNLWEDWTRK